MMQQAVGDLIDRYNDLLAEIARRQPRFRHVDLRDMVSAADWVNELHLSSAAYRRVAGRMAEVVRGCFNEQRQKARLSTVVRTRR